MSRKSGVALALGALCAVILLQACGGGGGGAGSASTGLRVLHAAIELAPVEALSSVKADAAVQSAFFAQSVAYAGLDAVKQDLIVQIVGRPQDQLARFSLDVASGDRYSLLIYGANGVSPAQVALLADAKPELERGQAAIRLINGLAGTRALSAVVGESQAIEAAALGSASSYVIVPAGAARAVVAGAGILYDGVLTLNERGSYSLLIGGDEEYYNYVNLLAD